MFNWVNCHALTYIPKISTQRIFCPNKWLLMINLRIIFEDFQMGNSKHAVLALNVFVAHLFPLLLCQNFRFDTRK